MAKVIRPLRFDNVRRARRNTKRRAAYHVRRESEVRRQRFFNRIFWVDELEPQLMWEAGPEANDKWMNYLLLRDG